MKMQTVVVVLCALVGAAVAQSSPNFLKRGQCSKNIVPISGFDKERYTGRWYRIGGIRNPDEEISVKCTTHDYSSTASGFEMISRGQDHKDEPSRKTTSMTLDNPAIASFGLTANNRPVQLVVLETDYDSYSCLVSCTDIAGTHFAQFAMIMSRTTTLDKQFIGRCQLALKDAGVPVARLKGTRQGDQCTYPQP